MTRQFLVLIIAFSLSSIGAASSVETTVTIRTYNYTAVSAEHLENARRTADAIFRRAAISLRWIDCRVAQNAPGAACVEPLEPRDLILRLMDHLPENRGIDRTPALGISMIDHEQRGGVLMTIDLLSIRTIAEQSFTDEPSLLGRAIAHEIGHLLLGTSQHSAQGLMRALWSRDELRGVRPSHWEFSRREADEMHRTLGLRAR